MKQKMKNRFDPAGHKHARGKEVVMFYEVRILNADMKIKKVISQGELVRRFWRRFHMDEKKHGLLSSGRNKLPDKVRKQLMSRFPELYDLSYLNN